MPISSSHKVRAKDRQRITCGTMGCDKPADRCAHVTWNTGNIEGMSFFYYCLPHFEQSVQRENERQSAQSLAQEKYLRETIRTYEEKLHALKERQRELGLCS